MRATAHDGLGDLIAPGAEVEELVAGCGFTEGPVWVDGGYLLFSDIAADQLLRWHPQDGKAVVREPNHKGNGMTVDNEGRLLVCEHATSRVTRQTSGLDREPIATHYGAAELNSPNDVIVASDGSVIFTDPTYGRVSAELGVVREIPQRVRGVYRLVPGRVGLQCLVSDMEQPNGLCLSRDEELLYVGDTGRGHVRAFAMSDGAPLKDAGVFASGISETTVCDDGYVDGMKIDEHGNLYVTGPGGIWVYDPDGVRLGTIAVPQQVANLNWGDDDWRSLYITAQTSLYRLRLTVAGHRLGYMR